MQQLPSIAVVGLPSSAREQIASHLFGPASGASSSRTWTIETKYYTAQVQVLEFCSITETDAPNVQAMLLVASASAPESIGDLSAQLDALQSADAAVSMLLLAHDDSSWRHHGANMDKQDSALDYSSLCATRCIELVHVPPPPWRPLTAMTSSRRMLAAADNDEDSDGEDGLTRVIDALMCHMWPGMIRKTPTMGGGAAAAKVAPAVISAAIPAKVAVAGSESTDREHIAAAGGLDSDGFGHFTTDEDDDSFSRLVAEARSVRENGASLPDEERREQAAKVAFRMLQMFGLDDEDGQASSSDSDE